ncbi:hypothetical protein C8Q79DRAFT_641790 [Trametes meyenii]|nr:hypothetical protein C8Q79DRAFT_641790 [Trametes meyenii]
MFGEHESESPRVPSPWDPFLPSPPDNTPPLLPASLPNGVPKLVPEVEEGNVEYKLKLTNISNTRFARLVTQLKWRLLEGGGQAYYELGVADSGALIGLSRADLEESLATLEMMAGEIGASVIVVKEIEVPPTIAALADKHSGYADPDTGEWTRKMTRRAAGPLVSSSGDGDGDAYTTTTETEPETDLTTDYDDVASSVERTPGPATPVSIYPPNDIPGGRASLPRPIRSKPDRPTAQSSPRIAPLDDDLALFSMEPEPAFLPTSKPTISGFVSLRGTSGDDDFFDLGPRHASYAGVEISAVYKPRPVRHRARPGTSGLLAPGLGPGAGRHGKRFNNGKPKEKKVHPWHQNAHAKGAGASADVAIANAGSRGVKGAAPAMSKEEKALQRRLARDKKREEKRAALIARAEAEVAIAETDARPAAPTPSSAAGIPTSAVPAVVEAEGLAAEMATLGLVASMEAESHTLADGASELYAAVDVEGGSVHAREGCAEKEGPGLEARAGLVDVVGANAERRLIVEALVVRKMSIEEATLDFGGFALV